MPTGSGAAACSSPASLLMVVGGRRLRAHRLAAAAHPRGDDRGHLADRQRGRPVPRRRAGRPVADRAGPSAGPPRSPGTTSSATSRRPPARSPPGCSARSCWIEAWRRSMPTARSSSAMPLIGLRHGRRLLAARRPPSRRRRANGGATTASARSSACGDRAASSSGCRRCSRSTPSRAASSRRA